MDAALRALLTELYAFGCQHDAAHTEHAERMLNITPDTGEFLRMLVIAGNLKRVLELGTSNGYSTLWLADGCRRIGGQVTTLEKSGSKHALALENIRRAGLERWVEARLTEIDAALPSLRGYDLVFLDAERSEYAAWWPTLQEVMRPGGLMVVDNATSHAQELVPFRQLVERTAGFDTVLLPLGNGEWLILRDQ
jgi:predicted O-methyltransferase YrrM